MVVIAKKCVPQLTKINIAYELRESTRPQIHCWNSSLSLTASSRHWQYSLHRALWDSCADVLGGLKTKRWFFRSGAVGSLAGNIDRAIWLLCGRSGRCGPLSQLLRFTLATIYQNLGGSDKSKGTFWHVTESENWGKILFLVNEKKVFRK